jgi:hypothetical protein
MDYHAGNAGIIDYGMALGVVSARLFIVNHGWYHNLDGRVA